LISGIPYTIQVGDLSLDYQYMGIVDAVRHRVVAGNHDNYDNLTPHFLGDFGFHSFPLKNGEFKFFFIRGAFSIDREWRILGRSYWDNEELDWGKGYQVIETFKREKPEIVFSHDCPRELIPMVATYPGKFLASRTHEMLQQCFEAHQPRLWVFGHHHRNWRQKVGNTLFFCLDGHMPQHGHEMGYIDFDENGQLLTEFPQ
jgi:predicted phosphodiesterase